MSLPLKIDYGVLNKKINITNQVMRLNNDFRSTGLLFIPKDDIYRSKIFSDPVPGSKKSIMIHFNGKNYMLNELHDIFIDFRSKNIYLDSMSNIPDYIEAKFNVKNKLKLYSIHSQLKLPYHSWVDELPEQLMSINNITGNEKILEIGSNIGRNTFILAHLLNKMNNNNLVTLESNTKIYNELLQNKKINSLQFTAENAALSKRKLIQNHWNTIPSETVLPGWENVNIIDFDTIQKKHNILFDTLVLDCEGAFYYILMDMPEILDNIKLIIMENDYRDINHYNYVKNELIKNKFVNTFVQSGGNNSFPTMRNFYEVWKRTEEVKEEEVKEEEVKEEEVKEEEVNEEEVKEEEVKEEEVKEENIEIVVKEKSEQPKKRGRKKKVNNK